MTTVLRAPLVLFGYLVEKLRHLPVAGVVIRHTSLFAAGLIVAAVAAFLAWAGTVAPQRVALADLVTANVSHMQTWIIISGDLEAGPTSVVGYRYVLTDPNVPNALMYVNSDVELSLGQTTVSGDFVGTREAVPIGYRWIGTMIADDVLVAEPGPPWVSIILLIGAVLLVAAARVSYPMFFGQAPSGAVPQARTMPVGIRRGPLATAGKPTPGELAVQLGVQVGLRIAGGETQALRLHSVHTGVDTGELRHVSRSEPALRFRHAADELTLSFTSTEERDAAVAALLADARAWPQTLASLPIAAPHGELR